MDLVLFTIIHIKQGEKYKFVKIKNIERKQGKMREINNR